MKMKTIGSTALIALALTITVLGDIPKPDKKPKPQPEIETTMIIHLDRDAKEARLVIPRSRVAQLRAALDDAGTGDVAAGTAGVTRTQTIVSGLFLSLAIVFGGVWFARSGRLTLRSGRAAAAVALVAALGSAATFVFANAGPPPDARSITGKMFSQAVHYYKFGSGRVKLEVTDDGDNINLIVPDPKEKKNSGE